MPAAPSGVRAASAQSPRFAPASEATQSTARQLARRRPAPRSRPCCGRRARAARDRCGAAPRTPARASVAAHGCDVLEHVTEAELALAAPGAAIVEEHGVPARAAHRLREVEVALVAREAVQQDRGRVRPGARRLVDQAVHARAAAREGVTSALSAGCAASRGGSSATGSKRRRAAEGDDEKGGPRAGDHRPSIGDFARAMVPACRRRRCS